MATAGASSTTELSFALDPHFLSQKKSSLAAIEELEISQHESLRNSPFFQRYGIDTVRKTASDVLTQLYSQSFCNRGQLNTSHRGDCRRRRVQSSKVGLIPYDESFVVNVSNWFKADEELQDTFGVSGDVEEEKQACRDQQTSRDAQVFIIQQQLGCESTAVGRVQMKALGTTPVSPSALIPRAEIDILIGDCENRRKGLGTSAVQLLARYAHVVHGCTAFSAIVEEWNDAATAFFASLGFVLASRDDASETAEFVAAGKAFLSLAGVHAGNHPCEHVDARLFRHDPVDGEKQGPANEDSSTAVMDERRRKVQHLKCCRLEEDGNIFLVPYQRDHIQTYHSWMTDPHILAMTASEPLSLLEEYAMMHDWHDDTDKLTWIITDHADALAHSELDAMAGDVNLFFNDVEDPDTAEIDVMVAESKYRRRGFASRAVQLAMSAAREHLGTTKFRAKIKLNNEPSLRLFAKLGFVEECRVEVFNEVHLVHSGPEADPPALPE